MLRGFFILVRKGQRTGIFDLEDVDAIQLNPVKSQEDEPMIMDNPQILVDETDIKRDNGWFEKNWWKPLKIKMDEEN